MKKIKINIQDIVIISMILSMYLTARYLNFVWNKDVFPGIKIQITPIILIVSSLIFGSWRTSFASGIFIFLIAWTQPKAFISGVTYVDSSNKAFGEYALDYVIPIMSISIIPGLYKYIKLKYSFFISISLALATKIISHVIAGVLFWGGYAKGAFGPAWEGFVWSYSIVANLLGASAIIPLAWISVMPAVNSIKPRIEMLSGKKW